MNQTHTRKMILFQLWGTKLCVVFGLIPYYHFKNYKLVFKRAFKCYSVILACVMTLSMIFCLVSKLQYYGYNFFTVTLGSLNQLSGLVTFLITTFGAAFWNMDSWKKFIYHSLMESKMIPNSKIFLTEANFRFFAGNIAHFGIIAAQMYCFDQILSQLSNAIFFYIDFILTCIAVNIVISIKYRFEDINKLLAEFKFGQNHTERIKKLHLMTIDTVEHFNRIFGWPILGLIFHLLCQILECLMIFILEFEQNILVYLMVCAHAIIVAFGPVFLLFSCDSAVAEAKRLLLSCYTLQQYLPPHSKDGEDLRRLASILKNNPPAFTAAGFFQLNRTTLLYLLSTITTYFIVAIQFKN